MLQTFCSIPYRLLLSLIISSPFAKVPTEESFLPAAFMFYTDLQTLAGLQAPVDYGSGIEYADGLRQLGHPTALQIGLWLNGSSGCRDIVEGRLHSQLERLFYYLLVDATEVPKIFLRVGYEFDNPSFGYSNDPPLFRRAFRHLVRQCHRLYSSSACSNKISFVWHSWGAGLPSKVTLADFYPGDRYVDWVGVSIFSQIYTDPYQNRLGNSDTLEEVFDFASQHNHKPIMIAESTPFGGIIRLADPWKDWFEPIMQLIDTHDIAMWSYINCDWDAQPMWHGVGFGETRLSTNTTILKLWQRQVLSNPRFVSTMTCRHTTEELISHENAPTLPVLYLLRSGTMSTQSQDVWLYGSVVAALLLLFSFILCGCWRRQRRHTYSVLLDTVKADENMNN